MSKTEKKGLIVMLAIFLLWFQRMEIADFLNGVKDGFLENQAAHD